jgi:hypothetical protein
MLSFLPLHAAGLYDPTNTLNSSCLSDYCVVSYTPTVGSLLACQANSNQIRREELRFLLAAAADPFTSTALPEAQKEVDAISEIVPSHLTIWTTLDKTSNTGPVSISTAEDVLRLLPAANFCTLPATAFRTRSSLSRAVSSCTTR